MSRIPAASSSEKGINLFGFSRAEMGLGESCRTAARSLTAAEIPFGIMDFSAFCAARTNDMSWAHKEMGDVRYNINLFHYNPDTLFSAHRHYGAERFQGRFNIGYWHWELPDFPEEYAKGFELVQEVWVPTLFNLDTISRKSPVPVVRMPHGIQPIIPNGGPDRAQFGLPADSFLFLTMYDCHSYQLRKNPAACIDAFHQAFAGDNRRVGLAIKVNNASAEDLNTLQQHVAGWPNIHILPQTIERQELNRLILSSDCYVSLHRSEGFGLGLAEAMYFGKPVIATNWSGNTDFMDSRNSCPVQYELVALGHDWGPYHADQQWAEPDTGHAASYMRKLIDDPAWRAEIAARGQHTIRTQYSPEVSGAMQRNRLQRLGLL